MAARGIPCRAVEGKMRVIAVVGSESGLGKTRLACAILAAIPGLGAVKISPGAEPARGEWGPGDGGKDTARFVASGAALVARIVGPRNRVLETWAGIEGKFKHLPGIVVEGAGALDIPARKFTVFVVTPESLGKRRERDERLAAAADCIVVVGGEGKAAPEDIGIVTRNKGRVLLVSLAQESESWADEALVKALRGFLCGHDRTDDRR